MKSREAAGLQHGERAADSVCVYVHVCACAQACVIMFVCVHMSIRKSPSPRPSPANKRKNLARTRPLIHIHTDCTHIHTHALTIQRAMFRSGFVHAVRWLAGPEFQFPSGYVVRFHRGAGHTNTHTLLRCTHTKHIHAYTCIHTQYSALVFGQASSMLLSGWLGPGLSFLAGSWFGFTGGLVHRWRTDREEAKEAFQVCV